MNYIVLCIIVGVLVYVATRHMVAFFVKNTPVSDPVRSLPSMPAVHVQEAEALSKDQPCDLKCKDSEQKKKTSSSRLHQMLDALKDRSDQVVNVAPAKKTIKITAAKKDAKKVIKGAELEKTVKKTAMLSVAPKPKTRTKNLEKAT